MGDLLRRPRGTVYTAVLNFRGELERLGDALNADPYKQPPQAPVLFIKPPNTWIGNGESILCPLGVERLRMGGTLAAVIGETACHVSVERALGHVAGFVIANDVSIPHESYYRPPISQRCRDGFCPVSQNLAALTNPNDVEIRVRVNGLLKAAHSTRELVRNTEQLISDISEFMTLHVGDLLLLGEPENSPLARPGDVVRVEVDGAGFLENIIAGEVLG